MADKKEKKVKEITYDNEAKDLIAQVDAGKYDGDGPEDVAAVIGDDVLAEGTDE